MIFLFACSLVWQHPRMSRLAPVLLALLPAFAWADVNQKFAKLRDGAEALAGLGPFLEKYVGECEGAGPECKSNAAAFRREANGKHFYMILTEDTAPPITPGSFDPRSDQMTLNVTPFFAAGGYALTQGSPKKTDSAGNPVMSFIYVKSKLAEGTDGPSMARLVGMRALRMSVVFTPQEVWTLPKKEKGQKSYGVKARIDGILVTVGRTGEELAFWPGK
jgi:hypothetical protein